MITPQEMAEKMKVEIVSDMRSGIVPNSVRTFSQLHDYVDANCYGGSEALLDELDSHAANDADHTSALNVLCDLMNPAMEIVNEWLAAGGPFVALSRSEEKTHSMNLDQTVIPSVSDRASHATNMAAIDRLVVSGKYRHIIAWGKWLGFTPETVLKSVSLAETDNAPEGSIQKIDGRWLVVSDIVNETNRIRVDELARESSQRPTTTRSM